MYFGHLTGHRAKMAKPSANAVYDFFDEVIHCFLYVGEEEIYDYKDRVSLSAENLQLKRSRSLGFCPSKARGIQTTEILGRLCWF